MLPPLPPRSTIKPKSWLEDKITRLDNFLAKAVASQQPWWKSVFFVVAKQIIKISYYFGQKFPYIFIPYLMFAKLITLIVERHVKKTKIETARTLFLRRAFSHTTGEARFSFFYCLTNWITLFLVVFEFIPFCIEGFYAYGTYGTYRDVIVTQAYRNITNVNTFSVHGFHIKSNGEKEPLYFSIGPNFWYWDLYPEFLFGQVSQYARCDFTTYGITLRVPTRFHFLSEGALYVLNPWIISMKCVAPTIVPQ